MKRSLSVTGAMAVATLVLASAPQAHALNATMSVCRTGMTKSALKFFGKVLKVNKKCNDKNLKATSSCPPSTVTDAMPALVQKLQDGIDKKCPAAALTPAALFAFLGYPGKCTDPNPVDGFVYNDFKLCMQTAHTDAANALLAVEYNTTSQLAASPLNCQKAISKNGIKLATAELKAVQACRNGLETSPPKITGILGKNCATSDPTGKTQAAITKAESKARAGIAKKCPVAADLTTIGLCASADCASFCGTCDANCAADCIVATHHRRVDGLELDFSDIIDYEYATPGLCGDNAVDSTTEECDGTNDAACPGDCGAPDGPFPCLCMNGISTDGTGIPPRERVTEHKDSDLDNGWTGTSHDAGTTEGGGYVIDFYDCDGPGGPDTLCNSGPTCSLAPHSSCAVDADAPNGTTSQSICTTLGQGTCRKDITAVGPHCKLDFQKKCDTLADCTGPGNACVKTFHGPPLPLASGSIEVCVLNVFSEDVVGTKDVAAGSAAVRIRQKSITHGPYGAPPPCPVCGGFCQATQGNVGDRHLCTTDTDCANVGPAHHCVTDNLCSSGPNIDKECRHDPPFGGPTNGFGNPSVDCPPNPNDDISSGGLDILFNPATTGTTSMLPSFQCDEAAFSGKTCAGGSNNGATCPNGTECPGGTCSFQCFCPPGGGQKESPNGCDPACVGGSNDKALCADDSECPGGFCHLGDCRRDLTAAPGLQPNEGACTQTFEGHCSTTFFKGCTNNSGCSPTGSCAFCQSGETCVLTKKNCFINSEIVRQGTADLTNPVSASLFCIASTVSGSVNATAGLPGPGALHQPTTVVDTGF